MSAWKVSQDSTLPNQVFRALTRMDSGSTSVTLWIAARSVKGTPRNRSMTNILHTFSNVMHEKSQPLANNSRHSIC